MESNVNLAVLQPLVDDSALATINVASLEAMSTSIVVDDQVTYDAADALLTTLKTTEKTIDEERDRRFKTLKAIEGYVMGDVRTMLKRIQAASSTLKTAMLTFQQAEERRQREAQAELDRQAREQAAKLAEQAKAAEAEGKTELAEVLQHSSAVITAPVALSTYVKAPGVSTRKVWTVEITDKAALLRSLIENPAYLHFAEIDMKALTDLARTMHGNMPLAGVKAEQKDQLSKRVA